MPRRRAARGRRGAGTADRKAAVAAAEETEAGINASNSRDEIDPDNLLADAQDESVGDGAQLGDITGNESQLDESADVLDSPTPATVDPLTAIDEICEDLLKEDATNDVVSENILDDKDTQDNSAETSGSLAAASDPNETETVVDTQSQEDDNAVPAVEIKEQTEGSVKEPPEEKMETWDVPLDHKDEANTDLEPEIVGVDDKDEVQCLDSQGKVTATEDKMSQDEDCIIAEPAEEEALEADDDVCFVDKEVVDEDQDEVEEVQYIDEEAGDNHPEGSEVSGQAASGGQAQALPEISLTTGTSVPSESLDLPAAGKATKDEEIDNKFEEISEGSIEQEHEDLTMENISDVEITGESFVPTENTGDSTGAHPTKAQTNDAESLADIFMAADDFDVKNVVEDKDNDDISDASLPDHQDANLSLEEISDDDLEPSKKKRKTTEGTPGKDDKKNESTLPDKEQSATELPNDKVNIDSSQAGNEQTTLPGAADSSVKTLDDTPNQEADANSTKIQVEAVNKDVIAQGKDSNSTYSRTVAKRNYTGTSRSGQPESRDKQVGSRELATYKRRYINTLCQTEPKSTRGKIVQCNISVLKLPSSLEARRSSKLSPFAKLIPSSIPVKTFTEVTNIEIQKENYYSLSLGPVTLADLDCPMFRGLLTGAEDFSLIFKQSGQGVLSATFARHRVLASVIEKLKQLALGNRYMVMSVGFKSSCKDNIPEPVWKATLVFMYEQDIQMKRQALASDDVVRAKLCLKGVPSYVSKDFIHLMFPEALNVVSGSSTTLSERNIYLGFSNFKVAEQILSCYELFIMCGCKVFISKNFNQDIPSTVPKETQEESGVLVSMVGLEKSNVGDKKETAVKDTCDHAPEMDTSGPSESSDKQELDKQDLRIATSVCNDGDLLEKTENKEPGNLIEQAEIKERWNLLEKTESKEPGNLLDKTENKETGNQQEKTENKEPGNLLEKTENKEPPHVEIIGSPKVLKTSDGDLPSETNDVSSASEETKAEKKEGDDSKVPSDGVLNDEKELELERPVLITSTVTEPSTGSLQDKVDETNNVLTNTVVLEENVTAAIDTNKGTKDSVNVSLENIIPEVVSSDNDEITPQAGPSSESVTEMVKIIIDNEAESNKTTVQEGKGMEGLPKDNAEEILEDVSDEEVGNIQGRSKDVEEVVILTADTAQWVGGTIDLTMDEPDTSLTAGGGVAKEGEKADKSLSIVLDSDNARSFKPRLVMTDGDLEVSMEVIDVPDDDTPQEQLGMTDDKILTSRRKTAPLVKAKFAKKLKWTPKSYPLPPPAPAPGKWREPPYQQFNAPGGYNYGNSRPTYYAPRPHHPPPYYQDNMVRPLMPPQPRPYYTAPLAPAPTEDRYRAPARETTGKRREAYSARRQSPSPKRGNQSPSPRRGNRSPSPRRGNRSPSPRRGNRSPSPRRSSHWQGHSSDNWDRKNDSRRPGGYGDSRRPDYHSSSRQDSYQPSSRTPQDSRDYQHKLGGYTRTDSRGNQSSDRRPNYKRTRSRSLSDMSASSDERLPPRGRKPSYKQEPPKRSAPLPSRSSRRATRASRSPISVSSNSHSLSPVSKSSSLDNPKPGSGKEELVQTVKHFLELAKGIQAKKRRSKDRSESPRVRSKSPQKHENVAQKPGRGSYYVETHAGHRDRSRSPKPTRSRRSRSPSFGRAKKSKRDRSPSPIPQNRSDDVSDNYRRDPYQRESPVSKSKRSQKDVDSSRSYQEHGSRARPVHEAEPKSRTSGDQPWQQYPPSQGPPPGNPINMYQPPQAPYSAPLPPPQSYPPQQPVVYATNPAPIYQYNPPGYNYQNFQPSYPGAPPNQSYQAYEQPPPIYNTGLVPAAGTTVSASSSSNVPSASNKNAKSWSMGSSAIFQRVLGQSSAGEKTRKDDEKNADKSQFKGRVLTSVRIQRK